MAASVGAYTFPLVDGEEGKSTTISTLCTSQYTTRYTSLMSARFNSIFQAKV